MSLQAPWHARIMGPQGPVGAGVLVDSRRIVTCAHVVAGALDVDDLTRRPTRLVTIDFPQCARPEIRSARVLADGWIPGRPGIGAGDLAMLEVLGDEVSCTGAAPLQYASGVQGILGVLGHPPGHDMGTWVRTRLTGIGGPGREWMQLDAVAVTGGRIEPGFSGAGVQDEEDGTVVGIVVVADLSPQNRVAWMIPLEIVCGYWPDLRDLLQPGPLMSAFPASVAAPVINTAQLARMMLRMRGISDRPSRGLFVSALENQFGGRLVVPRQDDDLDDMIAVIDACLAHPGALHEFVERLRGYHTRDAGEEHHVQEIAAIAETVDPAPLLDSSSRNRLYRMLAAFTRLISAEMVRSAYREAAGSLNPEPINPYDPPSVIRVLESATTAANGLPPLIAFLEQLALQLPPDAAGELREWVDDYARREDVARHLISRLRLSSGSAGPVSKASHLLARLESFGPDNGRYLSHVTLLKGDRRGHLPDARVLHAGTAALTISEIPALFDSVLDDMWKLSDVHLDEVVIEFVMPLELLNLAVDQWPVQMGKQLGHPLCVEHHVIVRYLGRTEVRRGYRQWREKTERLRAGDTTIRWVDPTKVATAGTLLGQLFSGGSPCLAFEQPPTGLSHDLGGDAVSAAVSAGVPVIVWCRDQNWAASFEAHLRTHLGQQGGPAVPALVQRMRSDFINLSFPPGEHITLVWDLEDEPTSLVTGYQAPG